MENKEVIKCRKVRGNVLVLAPRWEEAREEAVAKAEREATDGLEER